MLGVPGGGTAPPLSGVSNKASAGEWSMVNLSWRYAGNLLRGRNI
jgi:hypothetical protein